MRELYLGKFIDLSIYILYEFINVNDPIHLFMYRFYGQV